MSAGGGQPGKSRHPTETANLGSNFKPPPPKRKKKFPISFLPFTGDSATITTNRATVNTQNKTEDDDTAQPTGSTVHVSTGIKTNNMFNIGDKTLEDVTMQTDHADTDRYSTTDGATAIRKEKIPPIVVANSNASDMQNLLTTVVPSGKFSLKLTGQGVRINLVDKADYDNVKAELTKLQESNKIVGFYNYHTPDTRPRKIVLYGLYKMTSAELTAKLNLLDINPTAINTLRLREGNEYQSAYLLYFAPGTAKIADLRKIKDIEKVQVRWEKYEPRTHDKIPQCHNCQMFGHSSVNCNMPTKCFLCSGPHTYSECPKKQSRAAIELLQGEGKHVDRSYILCANCGENHITTYKGCPARAAYIESQQNRSRMPQSSPRNPLPPRMNTSHFPPPPWNPQAAGDLIHGPPGQSWAKVAGNDTVFCRLDQQMQMMERMMNTLDNLMQKVSNMLDIVTRHIINSTSSR